MYKYLDFVDDLLDENPEVKREVELISLKYDIIRLLVDYRKNNKLSQADFAEKIGVKQQAISRFEKGGAGMVAVMASIRMNVPSFIGYTSVHG